MPVPTSALDQVRDHQRALERDADHAEVAILDLERQLGDARTRRAQLLDLIDQYDELLASAQQDTRRTGNPVVILRGGEDGLHTLAGLAASEAAA